MLRRRLLIAFLLLPMILAACATTPEMVDDSRLGTLARSLGMASEQAQAGLGSMLALAQGRLQVADFQKIAKWIPRAEEYMALAERLGAYQGTVKNADELNWAFESLGVSPEQTAKSVPAVTDYLSQAGGPQVGNLMTGALK